jgi:putative PIN family toxin of toxin-antitoxin system
VKIVLDTNVLVSGIIRPHGAAGVLLRMIVAGALDVAVDERILLEYEEVAARPKFGINPADARFMLERIRRRAQRAVAHPLSAALPDPDDRPFIEVAHAAAADAIVTGNRRHFPAAAMKGIAVVSPQHALDLLAGEEWAAKEGIAVYRGRANGNLTKAVAADRERRRRKLAKGLTN